MSKGSERRPQTTEVPPAVVVSEWERIFGPTPTEARRLEREAAATRPGEAAPQQPNEGGPSV